MANMLRFCSFQWPQAEDLLPHEGCEHDVMLRHHEHYIFVQTRDFVEENASFCVIQMMDVLLLVLQY